MLQPQTKTHRLSDPIAACGDRVYAISSQNGLFPDPWGGHVPREMWGVWDHPIKLLDGFWFGLAEAPGDPPQWLIEASECRACGGYNEFVYPCGPLTVTRRDFVPDGVEGMIVALDIRAGEGAGESVVLHALFRSDLRPAWLGEQAGLSDGRDAATARDGVCVFTDAANPWACVAGADRPADRIATGADLWAAQRTSGDGASAHLEYTLKLGAAGAAMTFFIAGSAESEAAALAAFDRLRADGAALLAARLARCQAIVDTSRVVTPDERLNAAMDWSKLVSQMLAREVPPYGVGVGAGLPEYPWWFGIDTEYAVLPLLQSGQFELARDSLRLLLRRSLAANASEPGRVIHELSTTGIVFNAGNMVETPAFTRAVHQYWLWTGDRAFLDEMFPFCKQGVLDYALGANDPDGDLCPSGRSIIETLEMHAGFEVVDVAAYTWDALVRLADLARAAGDQATAAQADRLAAALAGRIREEWWLDDEGLFADVRASVDEVEAALARLERAAHEQHWLLDAQRQVQTARRLFQPYLARYAGRPRDVDLPWLLRHWAVVCPAEVGLATRDQARRVLARLRSPEFIDEWGMVLHPDRRDVMSINTGILALTAARYGQVDSALDIVSRLAAAFSYRTPGAVCEALPGQWCFVQLWSNVGLVSPVVESFLGVAPRAAERRLRVTPNLPQAWDRLEARQVRVGDARFDIRAERRGSVCAVEVGGAAGWRVEIGAVLPEGAAPRAVRLNGRPAAWRIEDTLAGRRLVCDGAGDAALVVEC